MSSYTRSCDAAKVAAKHVKELNMSAVAPRCAIDRSLPSFPYLLKRARRRLPRFAFDFMEGGTGEHLAPARNRASFDAIEMVWRNRPKSTLSTGIHLFGHTYDHPIGISPVGMDGVIWPGASSALATAAKQRNIPYIAGTLACESLESLAVKCPGNLWFQLYGFPRDNHAISFDLIARAAKAGVTVLVVTLDSPGHAKRTLDLFNGVTVPFHPSLRLTMQATTKLSWAACLLQKGQPTCPNMSNYVRPNASLTEVSAFVRDNVTGCFSWDDLRSIRRAWPGRLVLKGIMSTEDALLARDIGADGVFVSNHGGRQLDASAASVDVLPAIADALGGRVSLLMDGGVRSGSDVAKALALGADAAFAGRTFLTGVAALGARGAQYTIDMLALELEVAMTQLGVSSLAELRSVQTRHPGEWRTVRTSVQPACMIDQ